MRKNLRGTQVEPDLAALLRPISGLPVVLVLVAFANYYPQPLRTFFDVNLVDSQHIGYAVLNGFSLAVLWIFTNRTLKFASASYGSIIASVTPVIVTLLAIPLLGETMSAIQMIGAFLIVASGYVAHYLKYQNH